MICILSYLDSYFYYLFLFNFDKSDTYYISNYLGEGKTSRVYSLDTADSLNDAKHDGFVVKIFFSQKYFKREQEIMDKIEKRIAEKGK